MITKHYIDTSSFLWTMIGFVLTSMIIFISFSLVTSLLLVISFAPFLVVPLIFRTFVLVKNGKIYKYTEGGKNNNPEITVSIEQIVKIKVEKIQGDIKHIEIFTNADENSSLYLKGRTMNKFLNEILSYNGNVRIV